MPPGDELPSKAPAPSLSDVPRPASGDTARFFTGAADGRSIALTTLFLLGVIAFLRYAQAFLLPVVLAILFYFLLKPAVMTLCRWRLPRYAAAALVLAIVIGVFVTASFTLQDPAREFLSKAPESVRRLEDKVRDAMHRLEQLTGAQAEAALENPEAVPAPPAGKRFNLGEALLSYTTLINTASFLTGFLETMVLLFFLLAAGDRFLEALVRVLPWREGGAAAIVSDVQHSISRFMVSISFINACVGIVVAITMSLSGMPNPVLWGVVAAVLNFMPYFGPLTVFTVLMLAGLLSFDSVGRALFPALVYLGIHAVESNLITPAVLGRRLTLNPLIIFLALMFWTWLWGIAGALLAVPLLMTFKILCDHIRPLAPVSEFLSG